MPNIPFNKRKWTVDELSEIAKQKGFVLLPFDFYLPEHNMCIEYQGVQHFKCRDNDLFGGKDGFKLRKKHDKIKENFCCKNRIQLLVISYKDFRKIKTIIKEVLL